MTTNHGEREMARKPREEHTRNILNSDPHELDEYLEYLETEGYTVRRIRESRDGRYWEVTFS